MPADRPALATARTAVVWLLPILILLQAVLAGQHLFEGEDVIKIHGYIGNATFALAVIGVPLTFLLRKGDGVAFGIAVALAAGTFAQVGLGYVGRESTAAAAWHIPLGVALIALSGVQLGSTRPAPRA